jgi:hypothetical protein
MAGLEHNEETSLGKGIFSIKKMSLKKQEKIMTGVKNFSWEGIFYTTIYKHFLDVHTG